MSPCPSTARSTNHSGDSNSLASLFKIQPAIEVSLWTVEEAPAQAAGPYASLPWAEGLFLWWLFIHIFNLPCEIFISAKRRPRDIVIKHHGSTAQQASPLQE